MLPSFPRRPWEESITSVIGERLRPNQPSLREREHLLRRSDRAGEGFTFLFSFLHICWTCCFMVVRTEGQNGRSCKRCWRKVEVLVDPGALHLPDHLRWSVPPSGAPRLLRQLQLDFFVIAFVIVGTIRSLKTTVGCLCCGGSCPVGRRCEAKLKETLFRLLDRLCLLVLHISCCLSGQEKLGLISCSRCVLFLCLSQEKNMENMVPTSLLTLKDRRRGERSPPGV